MKTIREISNDTIANDTLLASKQVETVKESAIEAAKANLNMRDVVSTRGLSSGTQTYEYRIVDTDSTEGARIVRKGSDYPMVEMEKTTTKVDLHKIGEAFELYREDILSSQESDGGDLQTQSAMMASRQVAEKENDIIINGDSDWEIDGLVDVAGSSVSSDQTNGWDEDDAGADAVQGDVLKAMQAVPDAFANGPFTLVVPRTEFIHLQAIDTNVDRDILDVLNETANIEQIVWDPDMPEDTAVLVNTMEEVVEYVMSEDINVVPVEDGDDEVEEFKVRTRGALVAYQPDGIVELTGI